LRRTFSRPGSPPVGQIPRHRILQVPPSRLRPHFVPTKIRLNEYPDGAIALFWGPHRIADFLPPQAAAIELAA